MSYLKKKSKNNLLPNKEHTYFKIFKDYVNNLPLIATNFHVAKSQNFTTTL